MLVPAFLARLARLFSRPEQQTANAMKRNVLVVANWKMHGQLSWIEKFVKELNRGLALETAEHLVLCPPFVYLEHLCRVLIGTGIRVGTQNMHGTSQGAFTGEVAAAMLVDVGCKFVILGHSERRTQCGEDDRQVAAKFELAKQSGLTPILCVGENAEERAAGLTEVVIQRQLDAVLLHAGQDAFSGAVIAYEPVWAIGTGNSATPEQAQAVHAFVRRHVSRHDPDAAALMPIVYGGSVKAANARLLAEQSDVDGALVGGASLVVSDFLAISEGFMSAVTR